MDFQWPMSEENDQGHTLEWTYGKALHPAFDLSYESPPISPVEPAPSAKEDDFLRQLSLILLDQRKRRSPFDLPLVAQESAEERFTRLSEQWRKDSRFMSSVHQMVLLPSYQCIIGMGWPAVPFILNDLKNNPQHWFWALRAITDIDPVAPALSR